MDARTSEIIGSCMAVAQGRLSLEELAEPTTAELLTLVDSLRVDMDRAESERASHVIRHGHLVACKPGCAHCCANLIVVYRPEAVRIAEWLAAPTQAEVRRRFEADFPDWWAGIGDDAARLQALHSSGEVEAAEVLYAEVQSRHYPCAFLVDDLCAIHPVRPLVCRNTHAVDTPDRCRPESTLPPKAVAFQPMDQLVQVASTVLKVLHRRLEGDRGALTLGEAVHSLLQSTPEAQ